LDWIAEENQFVSLSDWYSKEKYFVLSHSGGAMIENYYNGSISKMLADIYPEYDWDVRKFTQAPNGYWNDDQNCREFLEELGAKLGYKEMDDWYQLSNRELAMHGGGGGLNSRFNGSPLQMLRYFYPENDWLEFRFSSAPKGYWDSPDSLVRYMYWLGEVLEFNNMEDWYKVTQADFANNHGNAPITYHDSSPSAVVMAAFPEYDWLPWKFSTAPMNTWNNREIFAQYMDWTGEKLGYTKPDDWYRVEGKDFEYGGGMLSHYDGSPSKAVMDYLPDYDWKEWRFNHTSLSFWKSQNNRRRYMDWLGNKLGYQKPDDWYHVTQDDFHSNHGYPIFGHVGKTLLSVLEEYLPNFEWKPWLMEPAPFNFWKDMINQRVYMDWLSEKLAIVHLDNWYKYTNQIFYDYHGGGLLNYYNNSSTKLIISIYSDHNWKEWLFVNAPMRFWDSKENRHRYLDWLGKQLGFKEPNDWYNITRRDFARKSGGGLLWNQRCSHIDAVMEHFPDIEWDKNRFKKIGKNERRLLSIVQTIFPDMETISQHRDDTLRFSHTNHKMELDIWVPELNLAFEYQGEQHYQEFWRGVKQTSGRQNLESQRLRDEEKRQACKENQIALIEIPYTWDKTIDYVINCLIENGIEIP
jgi:hypothetical protein